MNIIPHRCIFTRDGMTTTISCFDITLILNPHFTHSSTTVIPIRIILIINRFGTIMPPRHLGRNLEVEIHQLFGI